jgi:hypothetical protein
VNIPGNFIQKPKVNVFLNGFIPTRCFKFIPNHSLLKLIFFINSRVIGALMLKGICTF